MITLKDGPAAGSYMVKRAPPFLRAVVSSAEGADVLDQLEDSPAPNEAVYVYKRTGEASTVHINRGRKGSGFYALAQYIYLEDVEGESVRDNLEWNRWAGGMHGFFGETERAI